MAGQGLDRERRRATIRDVAARASVDPSLVSRVVNGDPKAGASPTTRQRILDAVAELGYAPSVMARGLRLARTFTLGLQLPNLTNPMYADIARAAASRAEQRGYGFVFGAHVDGRSDEDLTPLLKEGRVDGLLVASGHLSDASLRDFVRAGVCPVVMINRRVRGVKPSVIVDDAEGSAAAVRHLQSLGHHRIVGIFGPAAIDTSRRRRDGFSATADALGIDAEVYEVAALDAAAGRAAAGYIIDEHPDVTAIYASTFLMGMGVLRGARDHGVAVPHDVSVIALHDSELADYLSPAMTTVELPVVQMAHQAVDLLIELSDGGTERRVVVREAPRVIVRDSTNVVRRSNV